MNTIVRLIPTPRAFPSERLAEATRDALIREMANHLVAGVYAGLNTADDKAVIEYLWNAPQRYHHRLVLDHMDAALYLAKQDLIAAEMSNG